MGNYNNRCISVNDFQYKCSQQIPYEGYVEGLGYASAISNYTMEKRKYYGEPESYFATKVTEQRLEISRETVACSQKTELAALPNQSAAGRIMKATLASSVFLLADDVTGIGIVDDIAIPFILAGGTIIATIAFFYEKSVGQGNKSYPGPWSETQLDKGTMQRQYGYDPVPEPPFDQNPFPKKGWGWGVAGGAVLYKQLENSGIITNSRAIDSIDHNKRLNFETPKSEKNLQRIETIKQLIQKTDIEIRNQVMPADKTKVVKYDRLYPKIKP